MSQVILPRSGILAFMDDEARQQFASYGSLFSTIPGQVLIQEGEVNTHLYVVLNGTFNITTQAMGEEVHLDTVGVGDCLGEVAIFHPNRASATVTSLKTGQLWSIGVDSLQQFLLDWPNFGCAAILGINIILSRRLKRANAVIHSNEIVPGFLSVRSQKRVAGKKLG
ncbi:MAG: cyclic nucleotide-binding domain-containing protein [Methylacidiphilales bacterium]|nr:cyclic nucleotide-binding domain-containing protein [Candidatus Methylacidiphilales bacterium]